jgi:hypothetical protein
VQIPSLARRLCQSSYPWLLLMLVLGACAWSLNAVWSFTIDDAGISYAYAKHLAEGLGPVAVVGGPRIEGYSNPLWVFLLVPVHWLGLSIPTAAKGLGALFFGIALAAGAGFLRLGDRPGPGEPGGRSFGAVEAAFVVTTAWCLEFVVWVPAGLENALFSALLLSMIVLDAREATHPKAFASSGLCAFALSITRPEGVLYAAPLLAIKLTRAVQKREPMRQAVTAALLCLGPLLAYHGWHIITFGELVPNTYYAKPGGTEWQRGFDYLSTTALESGLVYVLPLALVGLFAELRLGLLPAAVSSMGVAFVLYSGGDWMPHGRFLSLFAPAPLLLAALGLSRLARLAAELARERLPREVAAIGLATAAVVGWGLFQVPRLRALRQRGWCHFCEQVANTQRVQSLSRRAGLPSYSLVTQDFGGPSWLSDDSFYPIDFLGLCDRSIVLIRGKRARGGVRNEFQFYQYLLHEQPLPPSWILVPPNFWPGFDRSLEFGSDFYALSPRLVPRARRDSFFGLHRAELVDYFPPIPNASFRPLTEQLALLGFSVFAGSTPALDGAASVAPGARVEVLLGLLPQARLRGGEAVSLRVEAGGETASSSSMRLDRGLDGVGRQLRRGEPLALDFELALPSAPAGPYRLSLAVTEAAASGDASLAAALASPIVVPLGELAEGAPLARFERSLPRYPSALPAPTHPDLYALRQAVTMGIEQSRRRGSAAPTDELLSERLAEIGGRLDAAGEPAQAYLAYVWATQVNRRAWESLAAPIRRLRQTAMGDEHALELALLQRFYSSGDATERSRLVAFYLERQRPLEAEYFVSRWPEAAAGDALAQAAHDGARAAIDAWASGGDATGRDVFRQVAYEPLDGALDFESDSLGTWQGQRDAYSAGAAVEGQESKSTRGHHGRGLLASTKGGERARGVISSPEFRLDGRLVSLLVGGGSAKRGVGVELVIGGEAAFTASGNDSDNLSPVFWDVARFAGELAQLRVFDRSTRDHVSVDRVLIWR